MYKNVLNCLIILFTIILKTIHNNNNKFRFTLSMIENMWWLSLLNE